MTINRQTLHGSRARCTAADQIIAKGSATQMAIRLAIFCSIVFDGDGAGERSLDMRHFDAKRFQIRKSRTASRAHTLAVANSSVLHRYARVGKRASWPMTN